MCWGVLARVVEVGDMYMKVDMGGAIVEVLKGVPEARPGDVVIVHAGIAISRIDREDVIENIAVYLELMKMHYLFNGFGEEEATKLALRDIEKYAQHLGIGKEELAEALRKNIDVFESSTPELGP